MLKRVSLIIISFYWSIAATMGAPKFLVTGGCGFIGSHLVDALINEGNDVIVVDDLSTGRLEYLNPKATFIQGSICDKEILKEAFSQDIDGCFHLAAVSSVQKSNEDWLGTHTVNASGTVTLFEAAKSHQNKKIPVIYASSASIYGDYPYQLDEDVVPKPRTAYAADKYSCELQAQVAHLVHGIPSTGLRFFNVYGPRQDPHSPYSGVIAIFTRKILQGQPIRIDGDGTQARDFIYVSDIVRALMAAMHEKLKHPEGANIYNACTGQPTTLLALISALEEITGRKAECTFAPSRKGDIYLLVGRPDRLQQGLRVSSQVPLKEGLSKLIKSLAND